VAYNAKGISKALQLLDIPDMQLSAVGFDFTFTDMQVLGLDIPPPEIYFRDDNCGDALFPNISLYMDLVFKIQQMSYPYINDEGTGKLTLRGLNTGFTLSAALKEDCEYGITLHYTNGWLRIDGIDLKLESDLSFLYDTVMPLVTEAFVQIFNEEIGDSLLIGVLDIGNDSIQNWLNVVVRNTTDERFMEVEVNSTFLRAGTGG